MVEHWCDYSAAAGGTTRESKGNKAGQSKNDILELYNTAINKRPSAPTTNTHLFYVKYTIL